ncbi:MAG: hypothetical protein PHS82_03105 [Lachnospiraceae bacterium]|nr:hypothetical protein [Lachnospiraceae bacterium]
MSVLKNKRSVSSMQYVANAYHIESMVFDFVKRLSAQNQRILQGPSCKLASLQADAVYIANEIYPTNAVEYQIRRALLALSKATLHALDKRMSDVYGILIQNPQGAFCRKNGKPVSPKDAEAILNRMAEELGCMIDAQDKLIKGVRDKDKERFSQINEGSISNQVTILVESFVKSVFYQIFD